MVGSVEPSPEVWDRIRTAIGLSEPQAPLLLPEDSPPRAVDEVAVTAPATDTDRSTVIRLSRRARRWRAVASFTTAIAAALVALIAVAAYQPDLLPDAVRPRPRIQVVEVKAPPTPAPPSAQYVAVLQKEGGSPAFILTVDAATKNFTIRKLGAEPEPGKSFELWLISDKLPKPRSLGVIGNGDFTARPVLSGYDSDVINGGTYAVTVEQSGGSPDGAPHSQPVFIGKLIETVPATSPTRNR
jgi:anti-sigma-K factor RskA